MLDGATRRRLIDKGLRHQSDLIKEGSGERNALDQILGAFILAAEEVKEIDFLPA